MRLRTAQKLLLTGIVLTMSQGCAHFMEMQAIDRFAVALDDNDLDQLKSSTSLTFDQKALRTSDSLNDFKILRIPDGKTTIVNVQEISKTEKKVEVEVGERKQKLLYRLVRSPETGKWVVDDIYMRQKKDGVSATKSITDQMDLLLTVHEFLKTWQHGSSRSEVLSVTAPELSKILGELPPAYLARLTTQIAGDDTSESRGNPIARMDQDVAIVELARSNGKMVMSLRQINGSWKVADVAVEGRDEESQILSVQKMAVALKAATSFLDAYEIGNHEKLKGVCTPKLFQNSLQFAEMASVPLPNSSSADSNYSIIMRERHADFEVQGNGEIIKISLVREETEPDSDSLEEYFVDEVTLYDLKGMQQKRLSALFTAQAVMQLFAEALAERDLNMLRQTSTSNMNERVWNKLEESSFKNFPITELDTSIPTVESMEFHSSMVKVHARRNNRKLTYILQDQGGKIHVDDILTSTPGLPESLKTTMEFLIPIRLFTKELESSQTARLQHQCSSNFNRLIWRYTSQVPEIAVNSREYMQEPMTSVESVKSMVRVTLGNGNRGAEVFLMKEDGRYVVDEILVVAGSHPEYRRQLKETMRKMLAEGTLEQGRNSRLSLSEQPRISFPKPNRPQDQNRYTSVATHYRKTQAFPPTYEQGLQSLKPISTERSMEYRVPRQGTHQTAPLTSRVVIPAAADSLPPQVEPSAFRSR